MNERNVAALVAYCMALGCATFLCARGLVPKEAMALLLGAAIPTPFFGRRD